MHMTRRTGAMVALLAAVMVAGVPALQEAQAARVMEAHREQPGDALQHAGVTLRQIGPLGRVSTAGVAAVAPAASLDVTPTATMTSTPAITPTAAATVTPTATITAAATVTPTATITAAATVTPTATITAAATVTPTATITPPA